MSGPDVPTSAPLDSPVDSPVAPDQRSPLLIAALSALSVLVLLAVLATVGFGIMIYGKQSDSSAMVVRAEAAVPDPNYVPSGPKLTEFKLTERSGDEFESKSLRGKVWVASFFYSSCSQTCLQLNQNVQQLEQQFGKRGVTFLSITCDPETDTPELLKGYANRFGADEEQWLFLTGDMDYIARVGQDIFSAAVKQETHSNSIFIVDKQGDMRGRYNALDQDEFLRAQALIRRLIDEPYEPPAAAVGQPAAPAESDDS